VRALTISDGRLELRDRPDPTPAAEEVLVEIAGTGINRADLMQLAGAYPAPRGWPPDVPGLEFAGTVVATGPRVNSLARGDRVFGIAGGGAHASHILTMETLCASVPANLDLVEAGGVPEVFITAHDALVTNADLRSGERLLINGVGSGVGTAAVQLARALGATTVGTSRTPEKLRRAKQLGLDEEVVAADDMAEAIGGVDVVLELVGGDYLSMDVDLCRPNGRIIVVGLLAGSAATIDLGQILSKRLTLRGTTLRRRPNYEKARATAAFSAQVVPLLVRGDLRPVVDRVLPLGDAEAGYEAVGSNQTFGKVILAPQRGD
jgi:NADPH:quinone reductase